MWKTNTVSNQPRDTDGLDVLLEGVCQRTEALLNQARYSADRAEKEALIGLAREHLQLLESTLDKLKPRY